MTQTKRIRGLRNIITSIMLGGKRDSISGWDEMQGYPDGGAYGYDDTVGAAPWGMPAFGRPPMQAFHPAMQPPRLPPAPRLPPNAVQALQGGPRRLLSYMGLGSVAWESTSTETEQTMEAEPQAAFRGRRLVISQAKSSGAASILVTVSNPLTVSGMPQTPAPDQEAPVEMFDASTTYSMLDLQVATSATKVTLGISVSAIPASGETVVVAAGLYGEWLR